MLCYPQKICKGFSVFTSTSTHNQNLLHASVCGNVEGKLKPADNILWTQKGKIKTQKKEDGDAVAVYSCM